MSDIKSTPVVAGNHRVLVRIGLTTAVIAAIAGFFGVLDEAFEKAMGALESGRDLITSVRPSAPPVASPTPVTETPSDALAASPIPTIETTSVEKLRVEHDLQNALDDLSKNIDEVTK